MVKAGRYNARVVSYGVPDVEEGKTPAVALTFRFLEDGQDRELTWYGYLSSKAVDMTMKALITAGFRGDNMRALGEPEAFEDKEVSIVVEHETFEGKTRAKVKWINELGGAGFKALAPEVVEAKFGALNGALRAARAEVGRTKTARPQSSDTPPPGRFSDEDPGFDREFKLGY